MVRFIIAIAIGYLASQKAPTVAPELLSLGSNFLCSSGESFSYDDGVPVCRNRDGMISPDSTAAIPWWVGGFAFVLTYGFLGLFRGHKAPPSVPTPAPTVNLSNLQISEADTAEIAKCIQEGNLIGAIKKVREVSGLGLKEAKDLIEGNMAGKVVQLQTTTGYSGASQGTSTVETLQALKDMLDRGLLSQVEYETKKKEILARM